MYIFLPNEVADVDLAEFEEVGSFGPEVVAVPEVNLSVSIKGIRSTPLDKVEDCQNTFFVTYEPSHDVETELLEDPFRPGKIYRRAGHDYVELLYKQELGALNVYFYFLVDAGHCTFAYFKVGDGLSQIEYADLWEMGFVRMKS